MSVTSPYFLGLLALLATVAVLTRYTLLPVGDSPAIYRLDRWTGQVDMCLASRGCRRIPQGPDLDVGLSN